MRLSYLGKLPLFFTLGIDMRQFLLGTVQLGFDNYSSVWTVCQFLLGTVQLVLYVDPQELEAEFVSIPLRYGTT